jgi:hypothetical protein
MTEITDVAACPWHMRASLIKLLPQKGVRVLVLTGGVVIVFCAYLFAATFLNHLTPLLRSPEKTIDTRRKINQLW